MTTETDVVNVALTLLGEKTIASLSDGSKPARTANVIYTAVRDELLTRYNWTFAIKRGQAPGATAPGFGFKNAFNFPSDCLRIIRPGARYAGPDLTDYRSDTGEEYAIEGRQILTDWAADGTVAPADSDKVASIEITNRGYSWTTQPTVTIDAPPPGGVQATATAYLGLYGAQPNAVVPGTNYSLYDTLTLVGGNAVTPAKVSVFAGSPGNLLRVDVIDNGKYAPGIPGLADIFQAYYLTRGVSTTGGAGAGPAQLDCYWRVVAIDVTNPGAGYLAAPNVSVSNPGGTGAGCTAVAHLGNPTVSYLNVVYLRKVTDPNQWDPNFIKLLAAQLAIDLAEPITQSTAKRTAAENSFTRTLRDCIRANAIQLPPRHLLDDEWEMSRL